MFCQKCGHELTKSSKSCKKCGEKVTASSEDERDMAVWELTATQKTTLEALKKLEAKAAAKLDNKVLLNNYKKKLTDLNKNKGAEDVALQIKTKYEKEYKSKKIPMRVPLFMPEELKQTLKEAKVKKIFLKHEKGKGLKLGYINADGEQKTLVSGSQDYFTDTYDIKKKGKAPFVGLGLVKTKNKYALKMVTPKTAPILSAEQSRNQGQALYSTSEITNENSNAVTAGEGLEESANLEQNSKLNQLLSDESENNLLGFLEDAIDNVTWQDFSYYEYVDDPELIKSSEGDLVISQGLLDILAEFTDTEAFSSVYRLIRKLIKLIDERAHAGFMMRFGVDDDIVSLAYQEALIPSGALSAIYEIYYSLPQMYRGHMLNTSIVKGIFGGTGVVSVSPLDISGIYMTLFVAPAAPIYNLPLWEPGDPAPLETIQTWQEEVDRLYTIYRPIMTNVEEFEKLKSEVMEVNTYAFNVFKPQSTNLGLRLVYRQQWRPLGIQNGETVRTIPLGPKQTEKVSTKIIRRQKVTKTSESLRATESTSETTDTAKDSSEVIREAAESNKWNAEAEAGLDLGFVSIGGGGGGSGESSEKSSRTSTHLSETMQKTANKLRSETKVVVSSESESTFEMTTASEIQNPNDEVAITYVYSKLQRQYEIFTRLAEVQSVVYVAENLPSPNEVTEEWVKTHDWIIAKVLLDDSFRDALNTISQDEAPDLLDDDVKLRFGTALDQAIGKDGFLKKLAGTATSLSLESVDLSQEAQRTYREVQKEELEKLRAIKLFNKKRKRLLQHIRNNILHYCRAIWSQEDPEQRLLRYQKQDIRIPTVWNFIPDNTTIDFDPVTEMYVEGAFHRNIDDASTIKPVTEIINPAGPIGYAGNYAIFYLKGDAEISIQHEDKMFNLLHYIKSPYVNSVTNEFVDPAMRALKEDSEIEVPDPVPNKIREEMVKLVPGLRAKYSSLSKEHKEAFLKDGLLPSQRKTYTDLPEEDKGDYLEANDVFFDSELYYEYLYRKMYTRLSLVDTNNLIVDLVAGKGSVLENFKRLHRYVDVLKAVEEKETMDLENQRRKALITDEQYGDPDIEKVTVVANENKQLTDLIAGLSATVPDDA